jgi:hypothetical protein
MTTPIKQKAQRILVGGLLIAAMLAPTCGASPAHAAAQENDPTGGVSTQVHVVVPPPPPGDDNPSLLDLILRMMGNWGG